MTSSRVLAACGCGRAAGLSGRWQPRRAPGEAPAPQAGRFSRCKGVEWRRFHGS